MINADRYLETKDLALLVNEELARAREHHAPMNSAHEGYAVILEELDELWDEVKRRSNKRDPLKMRQEAIQVAAMAMRFVYDVIDTPLKAKPEVK